MKNLKYFEQKMKELLDDPIRGLKQSSDTNKQRYAILDILEKAYLQLPIKSNI